MPWCPLLGVHCLVSTASDVSGDIDIAETVRQRIQFQEEKRHRNIGSVVGQTAELLGDKDVPDHDWTARFFNYIQDVSSDEMQSLWAKVLAGEIEQPGCVTIRSLSILRNLDQGSAKLFQTLCSCCVAFEPGGERIADARVPSLGGNAGENSLREFGLTFDDLNVLNEHGQIINDYNSWYDMKLCIGLDIGDAIIRIPFRFQGRYWVLMPSDPGMIGVQYRLFGVALSQAGKEMFGIVERNPMPNYHEALTNFFATQNLVMTEVGSREVHVPQAGIQYTVPITVSNTEGSEEQNP